MSGRWRDERGSASIEALMLVPVVALIVMVVVFGGRVAIARQSVTVAAADAARAASLARTASQATSAARSTATATLTNQGLTCRRIGISVDTGGFAVPVGRPATVTVRVSCDLSVADLSIPGVPGSIQLEATAGNPLDTYRERR
ncbi:MAG: pilus assembly protein [Micropruina sp.]|nr:MAG: pilus assembly protein [Micropruina sp.]